jgi:hypothetical protein
MIRFRLMRLRLYQFVAMAALLVGIWLVAMGFASALVLQEEGKKPLWNEQTVSAPIVVVFVGAWLMVPSIFLFRRHNWARRSLMIVLLLVAVSGFFVEDQPAAESITHQTAVRIGGLSMPLLCGLGFLLLTCRPLQRELAGCDLDD